MGILRKTRSVAIVLDEFNTVDYALSTVKLVNSLQSSLNKSTIYRILDKLEDDGVLHSVMGKDGIKRYAKCKNCSKSVHIDNHPHFQCSICGIINCININVDIPNIPQYKIDTIQLLIQGECNQCNQQN